MSWSGITIDLFTNTVAILNSIVSNSYYEEPVHLEVREDFRQQLEAIMEATKVHKCFFVITAGILSVCIKVYSFPLRELYVCENDSFLLDQGLKLNSAMLNLVINLRKSVCRKRWKIPCE